MEDTPDNIKQQDDHQPVTQQLVKIFENAESIQQITNFDPNSFTLLDLFNATRQSGAISSNINFDKFKKLLYHNQTNRELAKSGFKVILIENRGHVEKNHYGVVTVQGL